MNTIRKKATQLHTWIYNHIHAHQLYIIADQTDSSVTLSRQLCQHINVLNLDKALTYMFYLPTQAESQAESQPDTLYRHGTYGFIVNPHFTQPTQLNQIQYNTQHRCIGFETLRPTVARIFHDYHIATAPSAKLSVRIRLTPNGQTYYEILRPHQPHKTTSTP